MFKVLLFLGFLALVQAKAILDNDLEWEEFKIKFGKHYPENGEEETRKEIFNKNKALVLKHNQKFTWTASLNEFSDMSFEEFNSKMNGYKPDLKIPSNEIFKATEDFQVPDELDYRKLGYVTEVKNQGTCGSCWSFSTTGSLEGQLFRFNKTLVPLSEQNLIDCSKEYENNGCHGGTMGKAFEYIKDNHGIDTEDSYPYEGVDNKKCRYDEKNKGAEDSGFVQIDANDKALLQGLVKNGPISVAIYADDSFKIYKNGVFESKECMKMKLNHAVLLVGHGTDSETGKKYWLVKNSWGTSWGENGYVRMSRDINNNCGIHIDASYPKL